MMCDLEEKIKKEIRELKEIAGKCEEPKENEFEPLLICPIFMAPHEREIHSETNDDPESDPCIDCHIEWGIGKLESLLME
jgi:hypothetical protein